VAIKPKPIFCAFLFAVACYLLAFGAAVFCGAPTQAGESFWRPEKFFYGLLPIFASVITFVLMFRLWVRAFTRRRNAWLIGCVVAMFAVVLDFTVFWKYRGRQDERIRVVWKTESSTFSWGSGEIKLPARFTYQRDLGIDTFVGHFTSQDGKLIIEHDIGELAGEHEGMAKSEKLTEGSRVIVGRATYSDDRGRTVFISKVSFPDSGCANFSVRSPSEEDVPVIESIAGSFHPKGWTPSWVLPLLPEVLRSDCRYRFELPAGF